MSTHRLYVAGMASWYTGLNTHGVFVCTRTRIPLTNAVCPPGDLPSPGSCHPLVPGSHGDMASGCHHNLQAPSERSCGTNDGMEKVFRTLTLCHSSTSYQRPPPYIRLVSESEACCLSHGKTAKSTEKLPQAYQQHFWLHAWIILFSTQ